MKRGFLLTDRQASNYHLVLKFAIPQMKKGKPKTLAIKFYNDLCDEMKFNKYSKEKVV